MTVTPQKSNNQPASSSHGVTTFRPSAAQMDEPEGVWSKPSSEDSEATKPINLGDSHYAELEDDLKSDAQNLEKESWSSAVGPNYIKSLNKEAVKRQDVIYELILTEMHHVRTLKILLNVYMHELKKSLLVDEAWMEQLFPGVKVLLSLHQHFLNNLKVRQTQCQVEGNSKIFHITQLGDILINQFSGTLGEQMIGGYSYFCSHQSEAIGFYKEQIQNNKKLQNLIKDIDQVSLVRRLGIPECFLLVTQRITKYPVLVERIIENTDADTEDYRYLMKGLELIKDTISQVNSQVCEYDKGARLREIYLRLDPKSHVRLKDGRLFRKEDLIQGSRTLLCEKNVTWKTSSRQKEVLAVLLSDKLILLQEKDQKFVFASMDGKQPVIDIQRVIVREVANEDKGLYVICACASAMAEMYEIHANSKEERNTLMTFIRESVESCQEQELYSKLITKLQHYQNLLQERDELIRQSLTQKQEVFAALYEEVMGQTPPHKGLLLRGDAADLQQGETLLNEAIEEVEILQNMLYIRIPSEESEMQGALVRRAQTFQVASNRKYGDAGETPDRSVGMSQKSSHIKSELLKKASFSETDDKPNTYSLLHGSSNSSHFPEKEVCDRVLRLAERLNSLKAVIAQQDSRNELQKAFQSRSKYPARHYSDVLLEQEKRRKLEKQKEELVMLQKQQVQHQEEQQRWEKEREKQRIQMAVLEDELKQREHECRKREEKVKEETVELEKQLEDYQQDLKRLRETIKMVDREREHLLLEKERLEKLKLKFSIDDDPTLSAYQSFRGSVINGGGTLLTVSKQRTLPVKHSNPKDIPPKVPPRRESISPRPIKQKLPEHLISNTNQVQKSAVQQMIPPNLASSSRRKQSLSKGRHKRAYSAANIDVSQVLPIRVTGKEGGSLKSVSSNTSQRALNSDTFRPPGPAQNVKPSQSFSTNKQDSSESSPPPPPPFPKEVLMNGKEQEIMV
ncbi:rho guanine nucleotide exchange factor 18a [Nothobranchius furzeri]|uniref:Rho guanine nucleotide exchange factor 18-like n=3 Tax=Nothobranchius TaxID=28779 RepID=A0A1A7ZBY4_NOTFU|nr:rho guanine nucleotide exchange factor 18 [Nothobranchius furzeri]KAF7222185.1 rho guanine nucleotide exchange factor 18-like [Nothobranchius furzeri]